MKLEGIKNVSFTFYDPIKPTQDQSKAFAIFNHAWVLMKDHKRELNARLTALKNELGINKKSGIQQEAKDRLGLELYEQFKAEYDKLFERRNCIQNEAFMPANWDFISAFPNATDVSASRSFLALTCEDWLPLDDLSLYKLYSLVVDLNTVFVKIYIHPMVQFAFFRRVKHIEHKQHEIRCLYRDTSESDRREYFHPIPPPKEGGANLFGGDFA